MVRDVLLALVAEEVTITARSGRSARRRWAASIWAPELGPTKTPCSRASRRISVSASELDTLDDVGDLVPMPRDDPGHEAVGDPFDRVQSDLSAADRARLARLEGDHQDVGVRGPKRLSDPDQRPAGADARNQCVGRAGSCSRISAPSHSRFSVTFHSESNWPGWK